jgi:hypothetical protein
MIDLAIALSKLGVLVGLQPMFRLARDSCSLLVVIIAMNDAIGTTCCQRGNSYS